MKFVSITFVCLLAFFALASLAPDAGARPAYAQKEGVACQYCHVSSSPGLRDPEKGTRETTERNARGVYYGSHDHSFKDYAEPARTANTKAALFRFVWKEMLPDAVQRIAVGDVKGDGVSRLITLSENIKQKDIAILTVKKWNGTAFVTEFTAETPANVGKLQVGRFAGGDKPAVIATGDALWTWNGKTFVRKPAAQPLALFGTSRLRDGSERLLVAVSPESIKAYRINPQATGSDWLTDGIDAPNAKQVQWADMHATPEFFDKMGIPPTLAQAGMVGIWSPGSGEKVYLYHAVNDQDFVVKPNGGSAASKVELQGKHCAISFQDANHPGYATTWLTPNLDGICYDVVPGNVRGNEAGLLVLSSGTDGSGRALTFFAFSTLK